MGVGPFCPSWGVAVNKKNRKYMEKSKRLFILIILLTLSFISRIETNGQGEERAKLGDLIIRHEGKTLGPIGGIPHIGIYVGDSASKDGVHYDVIDLNRQDGHGIIGQSRSTDPVAYQDPGFYSVLDSVIPIQYAGEPTRFNALPETAKNRIREKICKLAKEDLGSTYGKYQLSQFPKGHSVNCGDWVLGLYDKALKSEGVWVMSNKYPYSDVYLGSEGLQPGELRDYAEIFRGSTDPSRLPGWLPQVGPPQSRGGVYIAPNPIKEGKGGSEIKGRVLKSRPSGDSLSWPVDLKK